MHLLHETLKIFWVSVALCVVLSAQPASAGPKIDTVVFTTQKFDCDLKIGGEPKGRLKVGVPLTLKVPRFVEYLVECESHEIPVKLYARQFLTPKADGPNSPMMPKFSLLPLAVLPNAVKAAAAPGMDVTATSAVRSVGCKLSPGGFGLQEGLPAPQAVVRTIVAGTKVRLTGAAPIHCAGTNVIEVQGPGWRAWFPNKSFVFAYRGRQIDLFSPSQEATCCWIE